MTKGKRDPEQRKGRVRARIEQSGNLPTLPGVVARIVEMVDDERTTARQLGAEIANDQVVSAKVLKLVNSGFYGFSQILSPIIMTFDHRAITRSEPQPCTWRTSWSAQRDLAAVAIGASPSWRRARSTRWVLTWTPSRG